MADLTTGTLVAESPLRDSSVGVEMVAMPPKRWWEGRDEGFVHTAFESGTFIPFGADQENRRISWLCGEVSSGGLVVAGGDDCKVHVRDLKGGVKSYSVPGAGEVEAIKCLSTFGESIYVGTGEIIVGTHDFLLASPGRVFKVDIARGEAKAFGTFRTGHSSCVTGLTSAKS